MVNLVKERNEVRRVLRRLSPQGIERLKIYAYHVEKEEMEDPEPPLTQEEEKALAISQTQFADGEGIPLKNVLKELW